MDKFIAKDRIPGDVLSNNGLLSMQQAHYVTIFSTGGKFRLVSTFTELRILTPAACSYTLVTDVVSEIQVVLLEWSHINNVGELYISTMYHSLYDILETERSWSGDCILQ